MIPSCPRQIPDHPVDIVGAFRVQAGSGLIQKQHLRPVKQGTGQGKPLPHSGGIGSQPSVFRLFQIQLAQQGFRPALALAGRKPKGRSIKPQIFQAGEAVVHLRMLCDNPGQGVDLLRPLGRINSQHLAASPAGESHAGQNLYSGCLSRPIGAQEAKDLPRIQPQGDAFQRPLATGIGF